jgi:hypothetical protein
VGDRTSNSFNHIGESEYPLYGRELGANVVPTKRLLAGVRAEEAGYESLLRDSYESPPIACEGCANA